MSNITLIIQREFLTRVKKKSFIIMSILGPLLIGGVMALIIYLALNQGEVISKIKVVDESGVIVSKLSDSKSILYERDTMPIAISREIFNGDEYYGILFIPADGLRKPEGITLFTEKQPNVTVVTAIESSVQKLIEDIKLNAAGIRKEVLDSIKTKVSLIQKPVSASGEDKQFSADLTAGIGFAGGLLIYLFVFMYGVQVMRGVMEEKTNRIVEVIISSVKPYQLMMGKIVGVALVGLTQFLIWVVLTIAVTTAVSSFMVGKKSFSSEQIGQLQQYQNKGVNTPAFDTDTIQQPGFLKSLSGFNFTRLLFMFAFYFIGGYLLYSALFAAIGAAVDSETDTQQFILPVSLPLIIAYIVSTIVMTNPESKLGYWFSIIPFTSPVVMMVRMPFDPPVTDIIISMIALIAGFVFTTWFASKIYRTGILMYGKKPTFREMGKWLFYKR